MTVPVAGRGHQVLAVYGLFTSLTTLTIALRVYCRIIVAKHRAFGWDDILALIAWVSACSSFVHQKIRQTLTVAPVQAFFVCHAAFSIAGVHHGTGQHAWNIHPETEIPVALKFWWLCELVYVVSNMAIKGSIAVMLLRLAVDRSHRVVVWTTLVITELFSAGFLFFFIFQCWPAEYFYTRYTGAKGSCVDTSITVILVYIYSGITCVGDWVFAILPCILVWSLQMPKTQKILVGLILAMGAVASAATIARIPYIENMRNQADFLYATTDVAIWSCSETGLAITAASCATMRPLFRSWFARSAFNKSGNTATKPSQGYIRAASPGPNATKPFVGQQTTYSVRAHGEGNWPAEQTELRGIPKGRILVEQCDSASVESATPSSSSTTQIVSRV